MAGANTCGPESFFNCANREKILHVNCQVRQLVHQLQCCSARVKGDNNITGCGTGGVTPDEMKAVIEELEKSTRQLNDEFKAHLDIQAFRVNKGRGVF